MPDLYEPNDSLGGATNLGLVSTALSKPNLSIDSYNEDWFKFQTTGNGATTVGINFQHAQGDLDLQVRDVNGTWLGSSTSSSNNETVNLSYLTAGIYYAQVYGWNGASNSNYSLTISPPLGTGTVIDDIYEDNDFIGTGDLGSLQGYNPYDGLVLQSNDQDWFQFQTTNTGTLNVRLDFLNSAGDLDFELYNSAGERVGASATSGDVEQISILNAAPGIYHAKVIGDNGVGNSNYSLTVDAPTAATFDDRYEQNDSLGGAARLELQNGQFSDNSLVLAANDPDWFQFTVPQNPSPGSNISANLVNSIATLGLDLYDQFGNWVNSSYNFSNGYSNGATVPLDYLTPGTYYADVWGYSDYANPANPNAAPITYGLLINAASGGSSGIPNDLYEPNDSQATAASLMANASYTNLTITPDNPDWFQFYLPANQALSSSLGISFWNYQGDLDLYLYDQNGNYLNASGSGSSDTESIPLSGLTEGTYYAQVVGWNGSTSPNYSLTLNTPLDGTTVADDLYEENDSSGVAAQLQLQNGQFSANSLVANDDDWFQFTVPQNPIPGSNINIGFSNAQGNLDLYLYDEDGNWLNSSYNWWDGETIALDNLQGGTYYAQVTGYGATNPNYSLNINAQGGGIAPPTTGSDDQFEDNDLQTSAAILPSGQQTFNTLRALDDDWYKFTLNSPAQASDYVSIDFQHNLGDLDLEVLTPTGEYLRSTGVSNTENISLAGKLAGDYYIHAYGYAGATNSYSLNVVTSTAAGPINNTGDDEFEQNDNADQAASLQAKLLSGDISFPNLKIISGDDDWFKFTTNQIGRLSDKIAITSTQPGDLDLEIIAPDGQTYGSYSIFANEEVSLAYLPAGEYKVKVYGYAGASNSDYILSVVAPVTSGAAGILPDLQEPNDTALAASLVPNTTKIENLNIHAANNQDWFKFNLASQGLSSNQIVVDGFQHASGDIDVQLYDASILSNPNAEFLRSSGSVSNSENISLEGLLPGEYYVKVFGYDEDTNPRYDLTVNGSVGNGSVNPGVPEITADGYEDNDTFETASNFGTTRGGDQARVVSAIQDQIDTDSNQFRPVNLKPNDEDWFKFKKTSAGNVDVSLTFEHDFGDVDLEVRDSNNQPIGQSQGTSDSETVSFPAAAEGVYYIRAYGYQGASNPHYRLQITPTFGNGGSVEVTADQFEPGNNERTGATVLQDLTSTQGSLSINNPTDVDWFKFTPGGNSTENNQIFINYDSAANLTLELYDQAGTLLPDRPVVSQPNSGLASISLAGLTGDGTTPYYAKVSGATPSPYSLSLNAPETASVNPGTSPSDQWTIMVYIAGDSNLARAGLVDINEMESIGLPDNVNVVVQYDGAPGFVSSEWEGTRRGVIQQDFNTSTVSSDLNSLGELNMGDPQTLTDFVQWGKNNYAAQNYAVVVWDHGGGRSGVAWDDTNGNANLSVNELTTAISNAGLGSSLKLLGLDACLMAFAEQTYDLKNLTEVFAGSQDLEPGDGWDYAGWFQRLADGGGRLNAEQMGGAIVDSYGEFYHNSETQSAIRTSALDNLKAKLDAFVDATANASATEWQAITQARSEATAFDNEDERDLGSFMQAVDNRLDSPIGEAARQVVEAVNAAVIDQVDHSGASGLSIYLPPVNGSGYQSSYNGDNYSFAADTKWTQFLTAFTNRDRAVASDRNQRITPDAAETTDLSGNITGNQNNNSASVAYYLGNLSGSEYTFSDLNLDTTSDNDWYRFKIEGDGTDANKISLVSATTAGLTLELYKAGDNGSLAVNSAAVTTGTESVSLAGQTAGTYFVKVAGNAANPEYSLKVNAPAAAITRSGEGIVPDALEGNSNNSNNNSLAKASNLGGLGPNDSLSIPGLNITTADQDWYMITPTRIPQRYPNAITINFDNTQGDLDLQLYKADGRTPIESSSTSDRNYESISFPTGDDPVYIKVFGKDGATTNPNYTLDVVRRELDIDGNGVANANSDGLSAYAYTLLQDQPSLLSQILESDGFSETGAQRIYSDQLINYLEDAEQNMLDVDGNGIVDPSSDGLMIYAHLLLQDQPQALLDNVLQSLIGSSAQRTTPEEIKNFLNLYYPSNSNLSGSTSVV